MSQTWCQALRHLTFNMLCLEKAWGQCGEASPALPWALLLCPEWSDPFHLASFHSCFFLFLSRDLQLSDSMTTTTLILPKAWQDTDETGRNRISYQQKAERFLTPFHNWHVYSYVLLSFLLCFTYFLGLVMGLRQGRLPAGHLSGKSFFSSCKDINHSWCEIWTTRSVFFWQ